MDKSNQHIIQNVSFGAPKTKKSKKNDLKKPSLH